MSTYVVSDLHGHLELYKQIKAFLKPEDKVICLGDCGDRGPEPWETIKAVANDPQWTYLMGNHEEMLLAAMYEYLDNDAWTKMRYDMPQALLAYNGGGLTIQGWADDGADSKWISFLKNLPQEMIYENDTGLRIILCHAGYTPERKQDVLWDRRHFVQKWPEGHEKEIVIHGHTPCQFLADDLTAGNTVWSINDGAVWYCDGHKIDIDMGTYVTHAALLMDLDTFDEHIFTLEDINA